MLNTIIDLPEDKRIAGVHCIPITENGTIVLAWDKEEKLLTTIGGRIEENESIDEALEREAMEEVGILRGFHLHRGIGKHPIHIQCGF
ncbi:NUDIX domain-containing protein [Viridibacillus sp. FSL E2-0187]|uniref:NUDIX hydrolase n=1 Tax=Viridibacillus sp. FSL E2-0187 TaxID=2921362 RepID=UPI0030F541FF